MENENRERLDRKREKVEGPLGLGEREKDWLP